VDQPPAALCVLASCAPTCWSRATRVASSARPPTRRVIRSTIAPAARAVSC